MKKTLDMFCQLVLVLCFLYFATACGEVEEEVPFSSTDEEPIDSTPVGTVETSGFWVNAQSTWHPIYVNSAEGYGTDCIISSNTTTNEILECYIDVLEGDLFMFDINVQYNAPPNLCDHVVVTPAWHWNDSAGYGPTSVSVELDESGTDPVVSSCTAKRASDGADILCSSHPELKNVESLQGPSCVYDYSSAGGPNCCFGDYTLTISTDSDQNGTADTPTSSDLKWGNDALSCLGGSVRSSWSEFSEDGFPVSIATPVPGDLVNGTTDGLNGSFSLKSTISQKYSGNFSLISNFYTPRTNPNLHDGFFSATTSDLPYAVEPIDDLDGTPLPSGNPSYQVVCLDRAYEVKHVIKTYIREWNTYEEFLTYKSSEGTQGDPDVTGTEGSGCDYEFGGACNDFKDLDDLLPNSGTYDTTPAAVNNSDRRKYFPRVKYR